MEQPSFDFEFDDAHKTTFSIHVVTSCTHATHGMSMQTQSSARNGRTRTSIVEGLYSLSLIRLQACPLMSSALMFDCNENLCLIYKMICAINIFFNNLTSNSTVLIISVVRTTILMHLNMAAAMFFDRFLL